MAETRPYVDWKLMGDFMEAVLEKLETGEKGTIDLTPEGSARFIPD